MMEITDPMLHIDEKSRVDNSIQSYKRFAFQPITGTNYNNASPIVIRVENSDSYFRPCDSEIEFEGVIVKADGAVYKKEEAKLALNNNGLMYLFDNIKYELFRTRAARPFETSSVRLSVCLSVCPSVRNAKF